MNVTNFEHRLKPIKFGERLKDVIYFSFRAIGLNRPTLTSLINSEGGVRAAKRYLITKERTSEEFEKLIKAGLSSYTLEAVVLEFKDSGLFTDTEIEIAEWRLANYEKAEG
jgi:hypothetical protein